MRGLEDGHTDSPAIVHPSASIFLGLQEAGFQFAGVHGGELLKGGGAQIVLAAKGTAVQEHLAEARVVRASGEKASVPERRLPLISKAGIRRGGQGTSLLVFDIRRCQVGSLLVVGIKGGVLHAQRLEKMLADKLVEGESTRHLNNTCRNVDARLRVPPTLAGFIEHGRCKINGNQVAQSMG